MSTEGIEIEDVVRAYSSGIPAVGYLQAMDIATSILMWVFASSFRAFYANSSSPVL